MIVTRHNQISSGGNNFFNAKVTGRQNFKNATIILGTVHNVDFENIIINSGRVLDSTLKNGTHTWPNIHLSYVEGGDTNFATISGSTLCCGYRITDHSAYLDRKILCKAGRHDETNTEPEAATPTTFTMTDSLDVEGQTQDASDEESVCYNLCTKIGIITPSDMSGAQTQEEVFHHTVEFEEQDSESETGIEQRSDSTLQGLQKTQLS